MGLHSLSQGRLYLFYFVMYTLNKSIRSKFEMSLETAENLSEDIDSSETDINNANNATT
jgi:hypothetical protein